MLTFNDPKSLEINRTDQNFFLAGLSLFRPLDAFEVADGLEAAEKDSGEYELGRDVARVATLLVRHQVVQVLVVV